MKRDFFKLQLIILLAAILGCLPGYSQHSSPSPDLSGTWVGETIVPDAGQTDEVILVLQKSKAGYTGTITDTMGLIPEVEIEDVTFEDNTLIFTFIATTGYETITVSMNLTYEEGRLVGYWQTDDGTSGDIEFQKKE
jgi:hypothetical protein